MEFEEDQMQDHEHTDAGHSHSSQPHSHNYADLLLTSQGSHFIEYGDNFLTKDRTRTTSNATVTINSAESNIGGVSSSYRNGAETRPRNMKVIWVMKCW